jgi:hypothetical protein
MTLGSMRTRSGILPALAVFATALGLSAATAMDVPDPSLVSEPFAGEGSFDGPPPEMDIAAVEPDVGGAAEAEAPIDLASRPDPGAVTDVPGGESPAWTPRGQGWHWRR